MTISATRRDERVFAAVLLLLLLVLHWPTLNLTPTFDDVEFLGFHARVLELHERLKPLARYMTQPNWFRPAGIPWLSAIYLLPSYPVLLKLPSLCAVWLGALVLGELALRLKLSRTAAKTAAVLYACSWTHWSGICGSSLNFTTLASATALFGALCLWLDEPRDARTLARACALAFFAVLMKEEAAIFPAAALALETLALEKRPERRVLGALAAWCVAYALVRTFVPPGNYHNEPPAPWQALDWRNWADGLSMSTPLAAIAPLGWLRGALSSVWLEHPWRLTAPLAAAVLAWVASGGERAAAPDSARRRAVAVGLALAALGLFPYLLFEHGMGAHRLGRTAAGLALALAAACDVARCAPARRLTLGFVAALAAATFVRPDSVARPFAYLENLHDMAHINRAFELGMQRVRVDDVTVFAGFGELRGNRVFRLLHPHHWSGNAMFVGDDAAVAAPHDDSRIWRARLRRGPLRELTISRYPEGDRVSFQWGARPCPRHCALDDAPLLLGRWSPVP